MPPCLFHEVTGLNCPGCGGTRAILALLNGRLIEALHDNLLILILIPAALWTAWRMVVCAATGIWIPPRIVDRRISLPIAAIIIALFVMRNIPAWPFNLLAPLTR